MPAAPLPHYTIFERAYEEGWHVYEVEPLYDVVMDKMWDAWITHAARVVRYVSTARGIIGLTAGMNGARIKVALFRGQRLNALAAVSGPEENH